MRISRTLALFVLLAAMSFACAARPVRVALLANVSIDGDAIFLANLLPQDAPQRLRAAIGQISLGAAPQMGSQRQISRQTIAAAVASAGLPPAQFIIPAQITIRREGQSISSTEIFSAIQTALANTFAGSDLPNLSQLRPTDLHHAAIPAPPGYSGLEVTQVAFDPAINLMRFRLLPKAQGRALPFYVTANLPATYAPPSSVPSAHVSPGSIPSAVILRTSSGVAPLVPLSTPLVTTNQSARLHLHSADLDMLLEVRPLQRGYLDQVVRVRLAATGRTMRARVVAYGYLDATL